MNSERRALVVYESMFGNTETVARAVAEALTLAGVAAEVCPVAEAPAAAEVAVDLLVLGAPTHAFSLSRASTRAEAVQQGGRSEAVDVGLRDWLEEACRRPPAQPVRTAVFDTRATRVRRLPGSAARAARRIAGRAGLVRAGAPESFYVTDVAGPLAPHELDRARAWAKALCDDLGVGPERPDPGTQPAHSRKD